MLLRLTVRNSAYSTIGTAATLALGLVFAGLTIRYLGENRAGYLLAMQALLGVNALLGGQSFRGPVVQRMAAVTDDGGKTARELVGTLLTLNSVAGLMLALALILSFRVVFGWSRLDPQYRLDALAATFFVAASFLIDQVSGAYRVVYDARQRFDIVSFNNSTFGLGQYLLRLIVLLRCPSMATVAAVGAGVSILWLLWDIRLTSRLINGVARPGFRLSIIRPMFAFGFWNWLAGMGGFICGNLDRIVLTSYMGAAVLPYYAMPQRVVGQLHASIAGQLYFLFPMFASTGDTASATIARVEDRLRWFVALVSAVLYGALAFLGPAAITVLVGSEFAAHATVPLLLACIQGAFMAQTVVYFFSSWSVGHAKPNVVADVVCNLCMIATAWILIPKLGWVGASLAQLWRIPYAVWHTVWCRRLLSITGGMAGAFEPYVTPILGVVVAFAAFELCQVLVHIEFLGVAWLSGLVAFGAGLATTLSCENLWFASRRRSDSLYRAIKLVQARTALALRLR